MPVVYQDTSEAAVRAFEPDAPTLGLPTFRLVFEAVASGEAARGVVPVEHSAAGSVAEVLDLLLEFDGLRVVAERWGPAAEGATRSLMIAPDGAEPERGASMKTTLVLAPRAEVPNALFRSLTAFVGRRLRVYRLEPRPRSGRPGTYRYVVDVEGDAEADPLAAALTDLGALNDAVRVVGSYAAAPVPEAG